MRGFCQNSCILKKNIFFSINYVIQPTHDIKHASILTRNLLSRKSHRSIRHALTGVKDEILSAYRLG